MEKWGFKLYTATDSITLYGKEEPIGWDGCEFNLKRDPENHGIFYEFSTSLKFIKKGYTFIRGIYEDPTGLGIESQIFIDITANFGCVGDYPIFTGLLNLSSLKFSAEDGLTAECEIEPANGKQLLLNRLGNDIDLNSLFSVDNNTGIPDLPAYAKAPYRVKFHGADLIYYTILNNGYAPPYTEYHQSVGGAATPTNNYYAQQPCFCVAADDNEGYTEYLGTCQETQDAIVDSSLGGQPFFTNNYDVAITIDIEVYIEFTQRGTVEAVAGTGCPVVFDITYNADIVLVDQSLAVIAQDAQTPVTQTGITTWQNDRTATLTATVTLNPGDYLILSTQNYSLPTCGGCGCILISYDQAEITACTVNIQRLVEAAVPADVTCFAVHESLARNIESITGNNMTAVSDYFGRADSQPLATATLGCGGNEVITTGLYLRGSANTGNVCDGAPNNLNKLFINFTNLFDWLDAVHNLGFAIEFNTLLGKWVVRVEPKEYFYNETLLYDFGDIENNITKFKRTVATKYYISKFLTGYDKWKAEEFSGLDEVNTGRTYTTAIRTVKKELSKISGFVAGSYAIENTRRKSATLEDWRFDDNIFLVCTDPEDLFKTQKGVGGVPANMQNPSSVYNFAITPYYNALRWANIINIGAKPSYPANFLRFASGEANFVAEGNTPGAHCIGGQHSENQNINATDTYPGRRQVWIKPEFVEFDYPIDFQTFLSINANPYGLLRVENQEYWIVEMKYKPNANSHFKLIAKL